MGRYVAKDDKSPGPAVEGLTAGALAITVVLVLKPLLLLLARPKRSMTKSVCVLDEVVRDDST